MYKVQSCNHVLVFVFLHDIFPFVDKPYQQPGITLCLNLVEHCVWGTT